MPPRASAAVRSAVRHGAGDDELVDPMVGSSAANRAVVVVAARSRFASSAMPSGWRWMSAVGPVGSAATAPRRALRARVGSVSTLMGGHADQRVVIGSVAGVPAAVDGGAGGGQVGGGEGPGEDRAVGHPAGQFQGARSPDTGQDRWRGRRQVVKPDVVEPDVVAGR